MEFDRNAPELRPLQAMLAERHWRSLEAAVAASREAGTGDRGVEGYFRDLHLPERDRLLLTVAYSLWRGFGPALHIQDLWGMEPEVAAQLLAGLAVAVDREDPAGVLRRALELVADE